MSPADQDTLILARHAAASSCACPRPAPDAMETCGSRTS